MSKGIGDPWPEALPGLGVRSTVVFSACTLCPRWTWAAYGQAALCLDCATSPTTPGRIAYREALRRVWRLIVHGESTADICLPALDDVVCRLYDVGEPLATALRHRWEREWAKETGRCPRCGEPGPLHDEDDDG